MRTYDFDFVEQTGLNQETKIENKDDNMFADFDGLFMYNVINYYYSLKQLLIDYGVKVRTANMFCPFHADKSTGKPSAKYFEKDDSLWCFSESKKYTAYHALKLLYNADMKERFSLAWSQIPLADREKLLRDYGNNSNSYKASRYVNSIWTQLKFVWEKFSLGEVTFAQHKNALYKIFSIIAEEEQKKILEVRK